MLDNTRLDNTRPRMEDKLFADSMLETSWAQRARRSWTTLTSFGVQVLAIACLLLLPLWKTIGLPSVQRLTTPVSVGRPGVEPVRGQRTGGHPVSQPVQWHPFMQPSRIPIVITRGGDEASSQPPDGPEGGGSGPFIPGALNAPPISIFGGNNPPPRLAPAPTARAFKTSNLLEGNLIRRVQPVYPPLARGARIQGQVVLAAVISKAGTIDDLRVLSGHPMLVRAAIDAVSQWRYRPYILNNEPIEVETQITVNFYLGGG